MQAKIFGESQIFRILKGPENARSVKDLCRTYGMGDVSFIAGVPNKAVCNSPIDAD